jgi:hypothetical protein
MNPFSKFLKVLESIWTVLDDILAEQRKTNSYLNALEVDGDAILAELKKKSGQGRAVKFVALKVGPPIPK